MEEPARFPKALRVMADYGTSGIWVVEPIGPFRDGMVKHEALGLPLELAARFRAWITDYWEVRDAPDRFNKSAFVAAGRALARELKDFVGADVRVFYAAEDNLRQDEEII